MPTFSCFSISVYSVRNTFEQYTQERIEGRLYQQGVIIQDF